ncbi:MAG: MFS transporter [Lachnospiraceae bacterium]|nr:MFS transporter [Lachnospiraceae bacterium]
MKRSGRRWNIGKIIIRAMSIVVIAIAVWILGFCMDVVRMKPHYAFSTIAQAMFGVDDGIVVVDQGKTAIELLDGKHRLVKRLQGEKEDGFYYAEQVMADGNTLYIADTVYDKSDQTKVKKRLVALTGRTQKILFEQEYDLATDTDISNEILEFQVYEGKIYFILSVDYGLELYRIDNDSEAPVLVERYYCGDRLNDASIDLESGEVAIAVKRGYVRIFDPAGQKWVTLATDSEHLMPNCIAIRNRQVFFSDLYENKVFRYDPAQQGGIDTLLQMDGKPVSLEVSADGGSVLAGSADGFYLLSDQGIEHIGEVSYRGYAVTVLLRVVLGIEVLCVLWTLLFLSRRLGQLLKNENSVRVIIVVLAVTVVSCFVAYSLMDELFGKEEDNLIDNMKLFAELMSEQTDTQAISRMEGETFYGTSAYKALRQPLDEMTEKAFLEGKYYRYTIYTVDETGVRYVCNYDDDVMCGEPYDIEDTTYYRKAVETGNSYALSTRDVEGAWISLLTPLEDDGGEIVALLEVRMDMSLRTREKNNAVLNTVFNVFCTTAVVLMLILEGVLLLSFVERRQRLTIAERLDPTCMVPMRAMSFFTNTADAMQDAFVTILCAELYKGQLPIPDSVAVALPLSAQLLMLALFSSFMGSVGEKRGATKVVSVGLLVQGMGCLCCVLTGSYFGVLLGKMLIGAGMGTVYVNCYAIAAKGKTEESSARAFTDLSAGSLSGATIGAGLSSVFLTIGGWKMVYMVGAVLLVVAFLVAVSSRESKLAFNPVTKQKTPAEPVPAQKAGLSAEPVPAQTGNLSAESALAQKEESLPQGVSVVQDNGPKEDIAEKRGGIKQFMFNIPVLGYFLLILLPFMMSLAYREYFLPLVAGENNVSEVNISRFYLICGLAFLYMGPVITRFLMKHLGMLRGILLASSLMAAAMLLYVIRPTVGMVFFGMVMLSFVTSFSYGCMYTFFGELPQSVRYGEAKAMQVYSVFESIGSTVGPIAYGALLSFGNRTGLAIFGTGMLVLAWIYAMIMRRYKKKAR